MTSGGSTPVFWCRKPSVSACREGDNLILFDPDRAREKVVNRAGAAVWAAMDGTARTDDLAAALARRYEIAPTDEIRADARAFAEELLRDGFAEAAPAPRPVPLPAEDYSWLREAPRALDLSLTGRCNLRCAYCFYADEMVGRRDLPAERWRTFFRELDGLAVRSLTLSGGELFLRSDLWELLDGIVAARMRYSILTNGTLLTEKTLAELGRADRRRRLDAIQVSIDGSCAEIHDASRGKGSFDKAVRGLRLLQAAGFPATARVTVNRHNVGDLDNVMRLLLDEIGLARVGTNDAIPMGTGCARREDIVLRPEQRPEAMRTLARLEREYPGRITASAGSLAMGHMFREMEEARASGQKTRRWKMGCLSSCGCMFAKLAVHHDGMIVPCNMLAAASLGTIGETPIRSIWQDHPLLQEMRGRGRIPMDQVPGCADCEWAPYCSGGCPAAEYTRTGELNVANPECCYRRFLEECGSLP
ncbi:MAG: PqqD family peptide modification chaperone [Kiritimatiellia bacterium]